jgi:hypothetical protein
MPRSGAGVDWLGPEEMRKKKEHERYCVSIKEDNRSSILFTIY